MKKVLELLAWVTLGIAGLAWFWPAIMLMFGFPYQSGITHLGVSVTFMLINLVIDVALFWLHGGLRAIRRFREVRNKNNDQ